MSAQNPVSALPLWNRMVSSVALEIALSPPKMTPLAKGMAGADDATQHLTDHAPAFVLQALGDALLAYNMPDCDFTSESVRLLAEKSEAVKGWLAVAGREACYGGWWMTHAKLHHLERTGEMRRAQRPQARGRMLPVWQWPTRRAT